MKSLLAFFLCALFCAAPAAALNEPEYTVPVDFQAMADQCAAPVSLFALPGDSTFASGGTDYGHQLSCDPVAALAYDALVADLAPGVSEVSFDLAPLESGVPDWEEEIIPAMQAAVAAFVFDHPESQYCTITNINLSGTVASYTVSQRADAEERLDALNDAVDAFLADHDDSAPLIEQYRAIHDYICSATSYDDEAAAAGVFSEAHTAFGVLVDGRSVVCEGYSKSFKLLCDAAELPCMLVAGSSFDPGDPDTEKANHMWNCVLTDEGWYAVDVTWDDFYEDQILTSELPLTVTMPIYTYFLNNDYFRSDSDSQNHSHTGLIYFAADWPMNFALPELASGVHPDAADITPDHMTVTMLGAELTIPDRLWNFSLDGVALRDVPAVTFRLTQDASVSATLSVPAGHTYIIDSDGSRTLSHAAGFEAPLFSVAGELVLEDVTVSDGSTILPLLTLSGSGSFRDTADPELGGYLNYTGSETGSAVGYQASYDSNGRMLALTGMGTFRLTAPAIYAFGERPASISSAETTKRFLIGPDTWAPVSTCIQLP